jgi:tetratricopeptide (TPR) repeat protein
MGDASGGYYVGEWALAALLLGALALVASVGGALRIAGSLWSAVALALFAAYAAWTFASLLWSPNRGDAWLGAGQTLLYLLAFWLAVSLVSLGASRRWALAASAGGPAIVAVLTWRQIIPRMDGLFYDDGRLIGTVGYYNGEAAFFLVPFWVGVYVAGSRRMDPMLRGAVLAGAVLGADLAVLGQSRAAMYALIASFPIFFLLSGQRLRGLLALAPVVAAVALAFPGLNGVYEAFAGGAPAAAIEEVLPTVWLTAAGAGLYGLLWGLVDGRWNPPSGLTRAVGGLALVCAVALLAYGALAASARVGDPVAWAGQKWDAFKAENTAAAVSDGGEQGRYGNVSSAGRYTLWEVALEDFASHPVLGVGTGNYEATFYRLRDEPTGYAETAHSLPLEVLAERGAVGGILFFGFLAVCLGAGLRQRFGRLGAEGKAQIGAMVAAVSYWFVHSGVDWFWQLPAVTLPAVVYLALLAAPWRQVEAAPARWPLRALGAGAALLAVLAVAPLYAADRYRAQSYAAEDARVALAAAERARRFNPVSAELAQLEADVVVELGEGERAEGALREAIRLDPDNFAPYWTLASFYERRGELGAARSYYREALARNPLDLDLAQKALALDPLDPDLNRRVVELLARVPRAGVTTSFTDGGTELVRMNLAVDEAPEHQGSPQEEQARVSAYAGVLFVGSADTTDPFRGSDLARYGVAGPSDVAFADAQGRITEIRSVAGPTGEVRPQQPYRLAIVAERGFYEEQGVRPGHRAVFAVPP